MMETKLIFDSLPLNIKQNNLNDKIDKILQSNIETSICVIYELDSSYPKLKEIFKDYTQNSLQHLLQSYLEDILIFKRIPFKKNPYKSYNDKIPMVYRDLYNLLELTFKNINEKLKNDKRKISYLLIPSIK